MHSKGRSLYESVHVLYENDEKSRLNGIKKNIRTKQSLCYTNTEFSFIFISFAEIIILFHDTT